MNNELYNSGMSLSDEYRQEMERYFANSAGTFVWKLQEFAKFVPRQGLARFLIRAEMFRKVLDIQGSIIECGVFGGGGLMTWAELSAIYEPLNYQRQIIGFDTFAGFPALSEEDGKADLSVKKIGGLAMNSYDDILESVRLYDMNRFLNHLPKVQLIKGDMMETVPQYLQDNPHTIVSLMYLDVDVYEPTKVALKYFVPRMPKGAVIAFDQLNIKGWQGETLAVLESMGIRNIRIQRFSYDTKISYAVLE